MSKYLGPFNFGFNTRTINQGEAIALCDQIAADILAQDSVDPIDGTPVPGMDVPPDLVGFAFVNIDLTEVMGDNGLPLVDPTTVRGEGPGSGRWLFRLDEVFDPSRDPMRKPVQFHKVDGERAINLAETTPERLTRLQAMEAAYADSAYETDIGDPCDFLLKLNNAIVAETGERAEWINEDLLAPAEPDEDGWEVL